MIVRVEQQRAGTAPYAARMSMLIAADAMPAQPWRNGGGVTRELLVWPAGADWRLRLSLADIERDGPFSAFPGVHRHFAVIEGGGVALQFADGERRLRVGDAPLAFDGALAPGCRLLQGPTRDLNLMLRELDGELRLAATDEHHEGAGWRALFSGAGGLLQAESGGRWQLPPRSLLVDLPQGPLRWQGGAPAFWITAAR